MTPTVKACPSEAGLYRETTTEQLHDRLNPTRRALIHLTLSSVINCLSGFPSLAFRVLLVRLDNYNIEERWNSSRLQFDPWA